MNNQENDEKFPPSTDHKFGSDQSEQTENSTQVNIKPSEPDSGSEENAPGRTPGKAEGSSEIVEADLGEENEKP